jgi:hypothetical protein
MAPPSPLSPPPPFCYVIFVYKRALDPNITSQNLHVGVITSNCVNCLVFHILFFLPRHPPPPQPPRQNKKMGAAFVKLQGAACRHPHCVWGRASESRKGSHICTVRKLREGMRKSKKGGNEEEPFYNCSLQLGITGSRCEVMNRCAFYF